MMTFITFEGLDGCGKSTQAKLLKEFFEKREFKVYLAREPGGTPPGEAIRNILLDPNIKLHPWTEALLYFSSRLENSLIIKEKLKEDYIVICERYEDSTIAYQGYGRGLSIEELKRLNNLVTLGLKPDITIVLDMEPKKALQRKRNFDRMEKEDLEFYNKVRKGYFEIAKENKDRVFIVPAEFPPGEVHREILRILSKKIKEVEL